MNNKKLLVIVAILVLGTLLLTACGTPNPMTNTALESTGKVYGFWNGLWDGMTAIFAFIGNLFGGNFGVYQVHNNGNWYNFGFILGIGGPIFTASSASSRRK